MEVTTVSPSPASATEGDNLCDTDVTSVAIHSVTLLISLCGLAGNGAFLCLFSLKWRNIGIFDLAFVDFLLLLFTVPSALLFLVEDLSCSLILPLLYLSFLLQLPWSFCYWALFWLMLISHNRNMYKPWMLCCCCNLPECLLCLMDTVHYCMFLALFIVICVMPYLCQSHQQEHCRAALISMHTLILLLFSAPILIFHTINFIKAKRGSNQQKTKRQDTVISLIVLFIVLLSLCNFLLQLGYTFVSSQVLFLLSCILSSIKPFIYFLAGRCWRPCSLKSLRLSLQRVFEEPQESAAHSSDPALDTVL
ncbi:mas-related G-protein coupled receptor member H-like [Prinia subflava]|uniref:mas-related G-protein coupled receptor member H-like n=1 Tax=Prinia subflava TaxID=208062 RepID=UPI002FE05595